LAIRKTGATVHYYQFNIGDYASHTQHLDEIEDLAYRRMLDYCYLNEIGLPESVEEVARLIRMRTHCERIANVLREFFTRHGDGCWRHDRVDREIAGFREKSDKSRKAARKRWGNDDADALPTDSEGNADAMQTQCQPLTINHKPITNIKPTTHIGDSQFTPPTIEDVRGAVILAGLDVDPDLFFHHFQSTGWLINGNPMNNWRARLQVWAKDQAKRNQVRGSPRTGNPKETPAERMRRELEESERLVQ
jgi:uncharacterized protein YdaU (DUF1376 family)